MITIVIYFIYIYFPFNSAEIYPANMPKPRGTRTVSGVRQPSKSIENEESNIKLFRSRKNYEVNGIQLL